MYTRTRQLSKKTNPWTDQQQPGQSSRLGLRWLICSFVLLFPSFEYRTCFAIGNGSWLFAWVVTRDFSIYPSCRVGWLGFVGSLRSFNSDYGHSFKYTPSIQKIRLGACDTSNQSRHASRKFRQLLQLPFFFSNVQSSPSINKIIACREPKYLESNKQRPNKLPRSQSSTTYSLSF